MLEYQSQRGSKMSNGDNLFAHNVFLAMLAAAKGDDKLAGDYLRSANQSIAGDLLKSPGAELAAKFIADPLKASMPDRGEQDPENLGEE